jgi:acetyl esterase/lipase
MKAAGQDVEVHVYPSAYHGFDSVTDYGKRLPYTETSRNCPDREIDPVAWKYRVVGSDFGAARQAEEDVRVFIRRAFRM